MDECPHDSDPTTCPPCRRAAGREALSDFPVLADLAGPTYGRPITAQRDGTCTEGCGLPISVGEQIRSLCYDTHHGPTHWIHAGCE